MGKTVLIIGGGIGGHVSANLLKKRLGRTHRVVLVDRKTVYEFSPSLLWRVMGWREAAQITRELSVLSRKGIEYVHGEVTGIDPAQRTVRTSAGDLAYDYLIVALGADVAPGAVPGLAEGAHHFYTLEAAARFGEALRNFAGGRLLVGVSSLPFKCPAAPYEAALLIDYHLRRRGLREKVDLRFFTPEPLPMPVAGPVVGNMIKGMLEDRGIGYHPKVRLASVDGAKGEAIFEGGSSMGFDLLLAVPPHTAPEAVRASDLTEGAGWVPVDRGSLRTRYDDLYAIGDVALIKLFDGMALPKAGVFAHKQAEVVAHNVAADILGGEERRFDGKGYCFVEAGHGRAAFASGEFYSEPRRVNIMWPGNSRVWRWGKVLFEKYWLWRWF